MTHRLTTGETLRVKKSFFGTKSLSFAGMPSDSCFSIAISWSLSNNSAAHNLFFPIDQREIEIHDRLYEVKSVSPKEIQLVDLE